MAASPSRTCRMISTVRWQYGQRATFAPATRGTTRRVPLQRLRSVDGRKATSLYSMILAHAHRAGTQAAALRLQVWLRSGLASLGFGFARVWLRSGLASLGVGFARVWLRSGLASLGF